MNLGSAWPISTFLFITNRASLESLRANEAAAEYSAAGGKWRDGRRRRRQGGYRSVTEGIVGNKGGWREKGLN